jgi:hypothetical protein
MWSCDDAWVWHECYHHPHFNVLNKLEQRGMVQGIPHIDHVHQMCIDCIITKLKRSLFPSRGLLDIVHDDLCRPFSSASPGGKRIFLLLIDDKSRFMWLVLLAAKSDTLTVLNKFQTKVAVETSRRLRVLRTDNGVNSLLLSSRHAVTNRAWRGSTPHRTCLSRTAWLRGKTSLWSPWPRGCRGDKAWQRCSGVK